MYVFEFGFNVAECMKKKQKKTADNIKKGEISLKTFPDGEFYARVMSNIESEDCIVVKSICNSDDMIKTILILDAIKRNKAKSINLVLPYLIYMRQDKIFLKGEALSAEVLLKILKGYANNIFLINSHLYKEAGKFKYNNIKLCNIDAFSEIAKYFMKLKNPKTIAPDKGAIEIAKQCANVLNCESNYLEKTRDLITNEVSIKDKDLRVENKDVLICDDIISSGGTMVEALKIIKKQRPATVNLACVHGVFCDKEIFLMLRTIADEVVTTNTIPNKVSKIDLSELIAEEIMNKLNF